MLRRSTLRRLCLTAAAAMLAAGPSWAQAPGPSLPNPSFNVVNRTSATIKEVFATTAGMTTWGRNRLVDRTIAPGANAPIRLPADGNCVYDIRVVFEGGRTDGRRGLNTCNLDNVIFSNPGPGPNGRGTVPTGRQETGNDPTFRLVNRARSAVNELYATVDGAQDWGEDRLGDDTVAPGATHIVRLPNGQCVYDVRIVYASGEASEKRRLNLCGMNDMRVP